MEDRRVLLRRQSDRDLLDLLRKLGRGIEPSELIRQRKLRRAIRHTCKAVLQLEVAHAIAGSDEWSASEHEIKGRVLDLSEGGVSLFTKHPMSEGQKFQLGVKLYDGQTIEALAEVRWVKHKEQREGYAVGASFVVLDEKNHRRLSEFLHELDATLGL